MGGPLATKCLLSKDIESQSLPFWSLLVLWCHYPSSMKGHLTPGSNANALKPSGICYGDTKLTQLIVPRLDQATFPSSCARHKKSNLSEPDSISFNTRFELTSNTTCGSKAAEALI